MIELLKIFIFCAFAIGLIILFIGIPNILKISILSRYYISKPLDSSIKKIKLNKR